MELRKLMTPIVLGGLLSACATQESVHKEVKQLQTGPSATPHKSITNFASGLRCMDRMMIEYGVRDISMLVEDLSDQTGKINAGTKDMLITAVSDMTRRSRAVKLIPFGNDSGNLISFLGAAGSQTAYTAIPQYDIRGSVSQLDSSVVREQIGGSVATTDWGLGASASTAGSILGIDLSVLSTRDLSVLPGVTSSNAVVLFKSGIGADTDATIKKTGISFDFQVAKNEATTQALRNLIELASIELVGRLVKVPYWQCLDIPEESPEIQREVEDWYFAMSAHGELQPYAQQLIKGLGYYPIEVQDPNRALETGIQRYQESRGLTASGSIDFTTFKALLTGADAVAQPVATEEPVSDPLPAETRPTEMTLSLSSVSGRNRFAPGETLSIVATTGQSAWLYCFHAEASGEIKRFYPNRFAPNNLVVANSSVTLPGDMPFEIFADEDGRPETITCFASKEDLYPVLASRLRSLDFEAMDIASLDEVRAGFRDAGATELVEASLTITTD